jgi:hypothetical protein
VANRQQPLTWQIEHGVGDHPHTADVDERGWVTEVADGHVPAPSSTHRPLFSLPVASSVVGLAGCWSDEIEPGGG